VPEIKSYASGGRITTITSEKGMVMVTSWPSAVREGNINALQGNGQHDFDHYGYHMAFHALAAYLEQAAKHLAMACALI